MSLAISESYKVSKHFSTMQWVRLFCILV